MGAHRNAAQRDATGDQFSIPGIEAHEFRQFRAEFYSGGPRPERGRGDRSIIDTLVRRGLGVEVTDLDEARSGDIVQFSRHNGTSHACIFLGWEYSASGERLALHYWGAQGGRVSRGVEYMGTSAGDVSARRIHIVRALLPGGGP